MLQACVPLPLDSAAPLHRSGTFCDNKKCAAVPALTPHPTPPPTTRVPTKSPTQGVNCPMSKALGQPCTSTCDCANSVGLEKGKSEYPSDSKNVLGMTNYKDESANVWCNWVNETGSARTCQNPLATNATGCMQMPTMTVSGTQHNLGYDRYYYMSTTAPKAGRRRNSPAGYQVNQVGYDVHWMCEGSKTGESFCLNNVVPVGNDLRQKASQELTSGTGGYYGTGQCIGNKVYGEKCQAPPGMAEYAAAQLANSQLQATDKHVSQELYHAQCHSRATGVLPGYCDNATALCTEAKDIGGSCHSHVECGLSLMSTRGDAPAACQPTLRTSYVTPYPRAPSEYLRSGKGGIANELRGLNGTCQKACAFFSSNKPAPFDSELTYVSADEPPVSTNSDKEMVDCDPSEYCGIDNRVLDGTGKATNVQVGVSFCQKLTQIGASCKDIADERWGMHGTGICAGSKQGLIAWNSSAYPSSTKLTPTYPRWDELMQVYQETGNPSGTTGCMQPTIVTEHNVTISVTYPPVRNAIHRRCATQP